MLNDDIIDEMIKNPALLKAEYLIYKSRNGGEFIIESINYSPRVTITKNKFGRYDVRVVNGENVREFLLSLLK
ncbi:MAG: hypothetical protein EKK57_07325 [Proteobacteria bacterium]|nr:MAG: hypothetical protein EKK57_07325 [Pseudomonadota bacterium]